MKKPDIPVSVVVPSYNDAAIAQKRIGELTGVMDAYGARYEIVICDDGSVDGNWKELQSAARKNQNIRLLHHTKNEGIAATVRQLYSEARYPYVALFSLDLEWEPADVPELLSKLSGCDIVVGQRHHKAYPVHRHVISFFHNAFNRLLFGVNTYDAQSIKAFRRELLDTIPITSQSVYYEAERIIRAKRLGYRVRTCAVHHNASAKLDKSGFRFKLVSAAVIDMMYLWFRLTFYE